MCGMLPDSSNAVDRLNVFLGRLGNSNPLDLVDLNEPATADTQFGHVPVGHHRMTGRIVRRFFLKQQSKQSRHCRGIVE